MSTTGSRTASKMFRAATITAAFALTLTLIAGMLPASAATPHATFQSQLTKAAPAAKLAVEPTLALVAEHPSRTATVIVAPVVTTTRTTRTRSTSSTGSSSAGTATSAPADETAQAQAILAGYIAQYPILAGSTVTFGDAKGAQAIAYYKSGRIVISPTHTASLQRIIGHEIWHIIDWRDNGVIDWGENVPPQQ